MATHIYRNFDHYGVDSDETAWMPFYLYPIRRIHQQLATRDLVTGVVLVSDPSLRRHFSSRDIDASRGCSRCAAVSACPTGRAADIVNHIGRRRPDTWLIRWTHVVQVIGFMIKGPWSPETCDFRLVLLVAADLIPTLGNFFLIRSIMGWKRSLIKCWGSIHLCVIDWKHPIIAEIVLPQPVIHLTSLCRVTMAGRTNPCIHAVTSEVTFTWGAKCKTLAFSWRSS